ncbi:hypothetical protein Q1695_000841 [Nippostrongylus brasiliensis]|nr:hypothetical protein Q1695_000841 [Nippostrongylus brasiliensis]
MLSLLLNFILLCGLLGVSGEDTAFHCDGTEEDCHSKLCFYSIDQEKHCYRAGCASEELCHGRRNNECFMANSAHTCCCLEAGCAARYKGLNDCVDEMKNVSETATSEPDVVTSDISSTSAQNDDESVTSSTEGTTSKIPTAHSRAPVIGTDSVSESNDSKEQEEHLASETSPLPADNRSPVPLVLAASTSEVPSTPKITHASTVPTTLKSTSKITPRTTRYTTTPRPTAVPSTTVSTTTTITSATTKKTSPTTSARPTTSTQKSTPITVRPTTRTEVLLHEHRPLPDLAKSVEHTTRSSKTYSKSRMGSFAEGTNEGETEGFFSPAIRNDEASGSSTEKASTIATEDNKKPSSSLISVYEVTTLAVKNRENEEWKAPIPWWSAVVLGFVVSVVAAWAVVFLLKKKKQRQSASPQKSSAKEQGLVDPLLRTTEVSEQENSGMSNISRP